MDYILQDLFQFPTGWNYTNGTYDHFDQRYCFNSQRDGILHNGQTNGKALFRFQFPTGWNSTKY